MVDVVESLRVSNKNYDRRHCGRSTAVERIPWLERKFK